MPKRLDLAGQTFGKLTVLWFSGINQEGLACWFCRCECGKERTAIGSKLLRGRTKSCGCLKPKPGLYTATINTDKRAIHTAWMNMRYRCYSPTYHSYHCYGGRGIRVCDRWRNSFEAFYQDMEPTWARGLTIERIDVNGHYEPSNCTWVSPSEQTKNRRPISEWKAKPSGRPRRSDGTVTRRSTD